MKGMLENHPLFLSVFLCIAGVIIAAWEMVFSTYIHTYILLMLIIHIKIPQLNNMIQLAPFPDDAFRYKVCMYV